MSVKAKHYFSIAKKNVDFYPFDLSKENNTSPHAPPRPAVKEKMGLEKGVWVTGSTEDPFPESAGARASAGTAHLRVIFASPGGREKPQPFLSKTRILLYFCLDSSGKNVPKTSGAAECWRGNVGLVGDLLRAI